VKFGEKLIRAGFIDAAQLDSGLSHQAETGQLIGEALQELGYITEEHLMKFLAKEFNTRFVSTQSLSRAKVAAGLLKMVPQQFADRHCMMPILVDKKSNTLAMVTPEPQNTEAAAELEIVCGMSGIRLFVASRAAVKAAIRKHYQGDIQSFETMEEPKTSRQRPPSDEPEEATPTEDRLTVGTPDSEEEEEEVIRVEVELPLEDDDGDIEDLSAEHEMEVQEPAQPRSSGPAVVRDQKQKPVTSSWTRQIEAVRDGSLVSDNDFIETLNILVGLLEMQRSNMQGHSAKVARTVKAISERMGLTELDTNHNIIAAYLHDLGKRASAHLTLMSIRDIEDYRPRARRYHLTPARLFDSVHLPPQVNQTIGHLYECWNGTGIPDQVREDSIPMGSRIIAVVDAFEDLINNPANPLGQQMSQEDALDKLMAEAGKLFDPQVVNLLGEVVLRESAQEQLSSSSPLILVADSDNSATSVLELKLVKRGYRVRVARDAEAAQDCLRDEPVAVLLAEMHLEPTGGFQLLNFVRDHLELDIPVFLTSADTSPEAINRAFEMGVADFFTKPYVSAVVLAKIKKELQGKPAPTKTSPPAAQADDEEEIGVVIEMNDAPPESAESASPPDLTADYQEGVEHQTMPGPPTGTMAGVVSTNAQVLSGTLEGRNALALIKALSGRRKSGELSLRDGQRKGFIRFEEGHVFQANVDEIEDEEAFLELAAWSDCLYKFDPSVKPKKRAVKTATGKLIKIAELSEQ